ncbi:MAG: Dabb family protein, partial [Gemmataceae bacterium]
MMSKWLLAAALLVAGLVAVPAQPVQAQKRAKLAPYVHTVIFYVKKDAPKGAVDEVIADVGKLLADIPSVRGVQVGKPAAKATPEVAVEGYQVGLLCLFDDAAGLKEY